MACAHVAHLYFIVSPQLVSDSLRAMAYMVELLEEKD